MKAPMQRLLLLLSLAATVFAAEPQPTSAVSTSAVILRAGELNNVILTPGIITSLRLLGSRRVDRVMQGAKIFSVKLDVELGRLDLTPTTSEGHTNMIVTIEGVDYVFIIQIEPDQSRAIYTRTYTFADAQQTEFSADLGRVASAARLKPNEIDTAILARIVENARIDPVYRKSLSDFRQKAIAKPYAWNNCLVHLMEADAFLDQDMVLLKVQWVNTTGSGIYLNARQLGVRVAGKTIRVVASMQDVLDSWVLPGQLDTLWLVIQGERLSYDNGWEITLPTEARNISR